MNKKKFLQHVKQTTTEKGYCVIVVSEGAKYDDGSFVSASTTVIDSFGHQQLGGAAPALCNLIKKELGYKYHYAVADYLQRSARHIASRVGAEQAYAVGKASVEFAVSGHNAVMASIVRESSAPYRWSVDKVSLEEVANFERKLPKTFISENGFNITDSCREYLQPLIEGEEYPTYLNGLPRYAKLKKVFTEKKLDTFNK